MGAPGAEGGRPRQPAQEAPEPAWHGGDPCPERRSPSGLVPGVRASLRVSPGSRSGPADRQATGRAGPGATQRRRREAGRRGGAAGRAAAAGEGRKRRSRSPGRRPGWAEPAMRRTRAPDAAAAAAAAGGGDSSMEGGEDPGAPTYSGSPPVAEKPFQFPAWEESSGDENGLVIHSQVEEEEHKCLVCGESFHQPLSLLRHQKQQHAGERAFLCPECGRGFSLKHNLIIHQRIHTGEKPFSCGVCGKRFSLKQNLLTHQRVHGGKKAFACAGCGKSFWEQRFLLAHQKGNCGVAVKETQEASLRPWVHGRERPCSDSDCPESVVQRPLQVKHQETSHPNGAAFVCQECGEGFGCKSGLVGHQRSHQGSRLLQREEGRRDFGPPTQQGPARDALFQCLTCGKNFAQKGHLAAHRRSHLAEEMLS